MFAISEYPDIYLLLYCTPLANFRCNDPDIGVHGVLAGIDWFVAPVAAVAAAPAAPFDDVVGASCRDANFLNALNIAANHYFKFIFISCFLFAKIKIIDYLALSYMKLTDWH